MGPRYSVTIKFFFNHLSIILVLIRYIKGVCLMKVIVFKVVMLPEKFRGSI